MVLLRSLFSLALTASAILAEAAGTYRPDQLLHQIGTTPIEKHVGKHGVTYKAAKKYSIKLTWEDGAPNGQAVRKMIKMNGSFPGPNIVVDEGDWLEVTVTNEMPFNTTIHWHGLEMYNTAWSDGVPGLTQKPIEPGQEFVYRFEANPPGQYWYHSHSRGTLQDGLYGGLYIRPRKNAPRPFHLIEGATKKDVEQMKKVEANPNQMILSDWTNATSWEYMEVQKKSGAAFFCADSILLNGKGAVYCKDKKWMTSLLIPWMQLAFENLKGEFETVTDKGCFPYVPSTQGPPGVFKYNETLIPDYLDRKCIASEGFNATIVVDEKKGWASINWIMAVAVKSITVSIDEHPMHVYEVDGHYIKPQVADSIMMFNGERYSAMIKLDKEPKEYTIRVAGTGLDQIISGFGTLRYKGTPKRPRKALTPSIPTIDYGGIGIKNTTRQLRNGLRDLQPFPDTIRWPPKPLPTDQMFRLNLGRLNYTWQWTLDGKAIYASDRSSYNPLLFEPNHPDSEDKNLVVRTKNNTWVDIVLQVGANPLQPIQFPHSMHKHSNKAFKIGFKMGIWNYTSVAEAYADTPESFNFETPQLRDTFITTFDGPGWLVIRYEVVNPGPFLLHCHIETHIEGGMAIAMLDGVDKWPSLESIPEEYRKYAGYD